MSYQLCPCVFCGRAAALWTEEDGNHEVTDAWVECDDCHATGPKCDTEIDAVAKWNVPGVLLLQRTVALAGSPQDTKND